MLRKSAGFLNLIGEEYWIDFGTLLGFFREKGIIPHDIDVDFSIHESSYQKILANMDKIPDGFIFYDTSKNHYGPKCYLSFKGFDVDIYCYEDLGDKMRSYENSRYHNERQKIPKHLIYPLREEKLLGTRIFVPANPKKYLEFIYGSLSKDAQRDKNSGFWVENHKRPKE